MNFFNHFARWRNYFHRTDFQTSATLSLTVTVSIECSRNCGSAFYDLIPPTGNHFIIFYSTKFQSNNKLNWKKTG